MNNRKENNIKIFEDTISRFKSDNDLKKRTEESISLQEIIKEGQTVVFNPKKQEYPCKIHVTKNRTFEAAFEYFGKKVAVLNFASATNPGGGVRFGSSAQEECLCRVSNLYLCLNEKNCIDNFYNPHRSEKNNIHNDDIIYTPNVFVIKNDDYELFEKSDCFSVDVITCAAPNLRENPNNIHNQDLGNVVSLSDDELYKIHLKRATKILEVACSKNIEVLILGAFGCGAFRNNPKVVAKAYKDAISNFKYAFKEIEFAVYCSPWDSVNYEEFKKMF